MALAAATAVVTAFCRLRCALRRAASAPTLVVAVAVVAVVVVVVVVVMVMVAMVAFVAWSCHV